jgi:hypothetical protein
MTRQYYVTGEATASGLRIRFPPEPIFYWHRAAFFQTARRLIFI